MKFDNPNKPKKQATAIVWEATITVMNNEGAIQEFNIQTTNYDAILEKLERCKALIDNNYQFRTQEEEMPF